jgi:hypothetical protein
MCVLLSWYLYTHTYTHTHISIHLAEPIDETLSVANKALNWIEEYISKEKSKSWIIYHVSPKSFSLLNLKYLAVCFYRGAHKCGCRPVTCSMTFWGWNLAKRASNAGLEKALFFYLSFEFLHYFFKHGMGKTNELVCIWSCNADNQTVA